MDPLFSPESLLSPERLFGAVIEWRNNLVESSSGDAFQALTAMRDVHPEREYRNRKLFMSSVAREMDVLAAGAVEYDRDPNLADVIPLRHVSPEVAATKQAHIEYLNAMTDELKKEKEANVPEDARQLLEARQNVNLVFNKRAA